MKKAFALILAIVYLGSVVGATVHLHFCMDKLINWSMNDESSKCKNCGMEKDGGCCKDENKFFKNNIDQSATGTIQLLPVPVIHADVPVHSINADHVPILVNRSCTSHAPPIISATDILVRNCTFRI